MVRLKDDPALKGRITHEFQFHNGTIKSKPIFFSYFPAISFQFHNGTIKRCYKLHRCNYVSYFNSTMVRLKEVVGRRAAYLRTLFQFHNGTIKRGRHPLRQDLFSPAVPFQFHNGTIKRRGQAHRCADEAISIPQWYD